MRVSFPCPFSSACDHAHARNRGLSPRRRGCPSKENRKPPALWCAAELGALWADSNGHARVVDSDDELAGVATVMGFAVAVSLVILEHSGPG